MTRLKAASLLGLALFAALVSHPGWAQRPDRWTLHAVSADAGSRDGWRTVACVPEALLSHEAESGIALVPGQEWSSRRWGHAGLLGYADASPPDREAFEVQFVGDAGISDFVRAELREGGPSWSSVQVIANPVYLEAAVPDARISDRNGRDTGP